MVTLFQRKCHKKIDRVKSADFGTLTLFMNALICNTIINPEINSYSKVSEYLNHGEFFHWCFNMVLVVGYFHMVLVVGYFHMVLVVGYFHMVLVVGEFNMVLVTSHAE